MINIPDKKFLFLINPIKQFMVINLLITAIIFYDINFN